MLKIKPIVLAVLGVVGTQACAAGSDQQLQQQINQIMVQQQQLQAQIVSLKKQLKQQQQVPAQPQAMGFNKNTEQEVHAYSFVRLGSYLGQEFTQDGSELVINSPSVLAPDAILQQRYAENVAAKKAGYPVEDTPYMVLSGELEGQAVFNKTAGGSYSSDANLTDAELAMNLVMSKWINGLFTVAYDKDADAYSNNAGDRVADSRFYVSKAFITVGNLMYAPFYGSIGQMYLPFGRYSNTMVTDPLTKDLARIKARAISLGYYQNQATGLGAHAYVFKASGGTANQQSKLQNFGLDADYHFATGSNFAGDAGVGYVDNFADSQGILDNGLPSGTDVFRGFSWNSYRTTKAVGGYDLHAKASYNQFAALAEYVTAATRFNAADLAYYNTGSTAEGAKPSAFDLQGIYSFVAGNVPSSFVLDYGFTRQALALGLPKTAYGSTVNFNVWKDTMLSLEYRHDIYYPTSVTGTGEGNPATGVAQGQSDNVVTAQVDMYF